jgi:hypothetical protein
MRLARLVAAGLILGAAVGFVAAMVRPRGERPWPTSGEAVSGEYRPDYQPETIQRSPARVTEQASVLGAGVNLPTRPLPLRASSVLSGTGGSH